MRKWKNVIIIGPGFEQRVAKTAYSFICQGLPVTVIAQDRNVASSFTGFIENVNYIELPKQPGRLNSLPFGRKRSRFITEQLKNLLDDAGNSLVIIRDITYGAIVGRIIKNNKFVCKTILDIADNFDLFYDAFDSFIIRVCLKYGYAYVQKRALRYADEFIVVSPINIKRLQECYPKYLEQKKIHLIRNLPITYKNLIPSVKIDRTMVYVGRIDEISRDLFAPLKALQTLKDWTLHLYSDEKKSAIEDLKEYARKNGFLNRLIIHERVSYDKLIQEISKYSIGLIPHRRNLLTDYTIPNKIYDYRSAGIVSLMSDNPSLVEENNLFSLGIVYIDNIEEAILKATRYEIDNRITLPKWQDEFDKFFYNI